MKNAVIFLANGFEEIEALTVVDILRRAEIKCDMCSLQKLKVTGAHGIAVETDFTISESDFKDYECLILPGGMPGSKNLKENSKIIELVKEFNQKGKFIAAICAAPIVLNEAQVITNKKVTSFPGIKDELLGCEYQEEIVVQDGNLITSRGPATAMDFALKIVENLTSEVVSDKLKADMLVDLLERKIKGV